MSMFLDQPDPLDVHFLEEVAQEGPWGGPTYRYRGARIECLKGGRVCGLFLSNHPLNGLPLGTVGMTTSLMDRWLETHQVSK
jgi:hypothetical protein